MKKSTFLRSLLAVLFVAVGVSFSFAETYSYTFKKSMFSSNGSVDLNGVVWTIAGDGGYWGYDGTKGQQLGSGKKPYKALTLSTEGIPGTINEIKINTSGASSINATMTVSVGGTQYGGETKITTTATDYTFEGASSGRILFSWSQTSSKAIYVKSITITYTTSGGETPITPENPVIEPNGGEFEGSQEVTIVSDDEVWYTLTGDDPTEDVHTVYTDPFTITETTTVKAMAVNEQGNYSAVVTAEFTKKAEDIVEENYKWTLVKDNGTLKVGDEIVIVAKEESYALSTNQKTSNRGAVGITKDGDMVSINDEVQVLTLHAGTIDGKYAFYTGNGYLYAASSSNNHLKTEASLSDNSSWNISVTTEGEATIIAQGTNTRNVMQYNPNPSNGSPLFACYASASQKPVSIYKKSFEANILCEKCYYIYMGDVWGEPEGGCWYVAHFTNKNTGTYTWVRGFNEGLEANTYCFYLSQYNVPTRATEEPVYTHVEFIQVPASVAIPENISTLDLSGVVYKTSGVKYYDGKSSTTYNLTTDEWQAVGTSVERVEWGADIDYTNGEVHADGAIEVYSTGGVLVARGQDCVVLRDLNRGVYIVRCGDKVRKVVR